MIRSFKGKTPKIADSAFIAEYAAITGNVEVGEETTVWFNVSIRGDIAKTTIGNKVSIQDNSVLHQSSGMPLTIEDDVTVGHQCLLHSCIIRKGALVGMGSQVLDGAEIGEGAMLGAGSLLPPGKKIPPNTLALGRPAKVVRELTEADKEYMKKIVDGYVQTGKDYKEEGFGQT